MNRVVKVLLVLSLIMTSLALVYSYYITNYHHNILNRYENRYADLLEKYENLIEEKADIETILDFQNESYEQLKDYTNLRLGDRPRIFVTPQDTAVNLKVLELTGGWSNTSDFTEFWDDIREMESWVSWYVRDNHDTYFPKLPSELGENVEYEGDVWLFPNETLSLEYGDCEDQATLLCSMILNYQKQNPVFQVECIHMVGLDLIEKSIVGHLAVQISREGEMAILDPTMWYTGEARLANVSEEIDRYFDSSTFVLGRYPLVYRVFSDTLLVHFNSTDEYIQWMEKR